MKARSTIRTVGLGTALAAVAALALPALAGAHATVSPFQPQTSPLTAARTLYVLRVPNEKPVQPTYKVTLLVPAAVQEAISVKQVSDWKVRLTRKDTGRKNAEGDTIYATQAISWTARKGSQINPGFFGDFVFRFQNPATAQSLCFPTLQYYVAASEAKKSRAQSSAKKKKRKKAKPEVVSWTGPPSSEFPASCVNVVAAPPVL